MLDELLVITRLKEVAATLPPEEIFFRAFRYHEFDGGHTVPPEIAVEAFAWFAASPRD